MATNDTTDTHDDNDKPATSAPKRRATRKTARKTVKKTAPAAKKTTKKTTKKSTKKTAKKTAAPAQPTASPAEAAAGFDRTTLAERTRVHALAKQLGMTSKELIVALDAVGLVKVAQSALSREEADRVLDHLAGVDATPSAAKPEQAPAAQEESAPPAEDAEPEQKIRTRVRKNVENEIHQIEAKVDADLADAVEDARSDEPLEDVTPEITPAPEDKHTAAAYAPLFVAPAADAPARPADGDEQEDTDATPAKRSSPSSRRRTRRSTRATAAAPAETTEKAGPTDAADHVEKTREEKEADLPTEPVALKGSTRLESQRRRRNEMREAGRKQKRVVSQAEFLARRESVERTMVVRERHRVEDPEHPGLVTQVGVLEDDLLVEHFVTSDAQASIIGNIYLGRVQNVLPSMEAAFIDIGTGRNGVLYASEVDWKAAGLGGRSRRIEQALKSGDQVLVQVSKDPMGHKGARLTTQISLAGRYLVYVPGGRSAGISRKLPAPERKRLKDILGRVIPGQGGAIIRTAAENVPEEAIGADVDRLHALWEDVQRRAEKEKAAKGAQPVTLYEEPDMLIKVVRDLFNEDFTHLVVDGKRSWNTVSAYVKSVAPDLVDRLVRYDRGQHDGQDAFAHYRIDEQLEKALHRKVWLPSGGSLVIDRTEAMTVVDVNTGKFTGSGGNLEETVTRNNLEAAEEIVRQMRLRDLGGMIVVDFIDMVLPENQDLVLRRLKEALGRDRTRHQVSEVTSLGLVQMTRKRLGTGLLETFSTDCEHCGGRGLILHEDPVDHHEHDHGGRHDRGRGSRSQPKREERQEQPKRDAPKREERQTRRRTKTTDTETFEKIAAAVVSGGEQPEETEREERQDKPSPRRRGGRGRGRGRGRSAEDRQRLTQDPQPEQDDALSDVDAIVSAAIETAAQADPEEPSDSDYVAETTGTGEKTFQQAVAEFEASPRRRRRTRGNSRSDHRPKREDFKDTSREETRRPEPKQEPRQESAQDKPAAERKSPQKTSSQPSPGRRGRRRAVRKSVPSQRQGQPTKPKETDKPERPTQAPAAAKQSGSGRGRRRATRRRSAGSGRQ